MEATVEGFVLTSNSRLVEAAQFWMEMSFLVVPVRVRSKKAYNPDDPQGRGWQNLRITAETAQRYFDDPEQNIGVLLGDDFGSADVDLDCRESVLLAPYFLPETALKFGRLSKSASHWFYRIDPPIPSQTFEDPTDQCMLLELRCRNKDGSTGHQTVVPPSIHESGEAIRFEPGCDKHPANVDAGVLTTAVRRLAAVALLVRHWPKAGAGRHTTMLALAGALQRAGFTEDDALHLCLCVYRSLPDHDPGAMARTSSEVRDTFRVAGAGGATTGIPTLRKHLDKRVVRCLHDWLEIHSTVRESERLIVNEKGKPQPVLANGVSILRAHEDWVGVLGLNEFSFAVHAVNPTPWGVTGVWTDHEDRVTTDWLQRNSGLHLPSHIVAEAVQIVARENTFDPVRDYLEGLSWDGKNRIDSWLSLYLGVEPSPYTAAVGRRWLISAAARVLKPGCKADCVLILEGPQGIGKSQALRILGAPWFTDEIGDLGSKDTIMQIIGVWIVEIAELDSLARSEVSRAKAFLSRSADRFRPPYGRRLIDQPRRCVFAGTVNSDLYLRDDTGNRRFWPVRCTLAKLDDLRRDRDQLWAETVRAMKAGAIWWLDDAQLVGQAQEQQAERLQKDPWHDLVSAFIMTRDDVSTAEILSACIRKEQDRWERKDEMRVGAILRIFGWRRYKQRLSEGGNNFQWRYRQ